VLVTANPVVYLKGEELLARTAGLADEVMLAFTGAAGKA
jgi:hypothetical protein